eukprot:c12367_g1_i2.p1 GENE.c12367_g1_i2~~c12367_g1_i2.p1  ORF type:complete len:688 (-),score=180.23 c12367_g1_i2:547-2610(-)
MTPEMSFPVVSATPTTPTTTGYCSKPLPSLRLHSNQHICDVGSYTNLGQRYTITFSEPVGDVSWNFRISIDAEYGFVVMGDRVSIGQITLDKWKGASKMELVTFSHVGLGQHTVEVFGGQGCCDGEGEAWTFQRANGPWLQLSLPNLNRVCVTHPRISYFSTPLNSNLGPRANREAIESRYSEASSQPPPSGYCSRSPLSDMSFHSNQKLCAPNGSSSYIGQRFQINFEESGGGATWKFKIFMDAGYGYTVYLDGNYAGQVAGDVFAAGTNPFTFIFNKVEIGPHNVVVYGGEGCCDEEAGKWQVERNFQGFLDLTEANINTLSELTNTNADLPRTLAVQLSYFSTYLPESQGTVEANRDFIESRVAGNLHGGQGYCTKQSPLALTAIKLHSNSVLCGTSNDIGQRFAITFIEPSGGVAWTFKMFLDAGYGYAVYLDNKQIGKREGRGNGEAGVIAVASVDAGVHVLVVYAGEGVGDAELGAWLLKREKSSYVPLTLANLEAISRRSGISYFSTHLPSNQGTPRANMFFIENKFQNNKDNNGGANYCTLSNLGSIDTHSNVQLCPGGGSPNNLGQRFEIFFYENAGKAKWDFRIFMKSDYGYIVFFDDTLLGEHVIDLWNTEESSNANKNGRVYSVASVVKGVHRLRVYGGSGCCDAKLGDWVFQRNGGGYHVVSKAKLDAAAVAIM